MTSCNVSYGVPVIVKSVSFGLNIPSLVLPLTQPDSSSYSPFGIDNSIGLLYKIFRLSES